jgi:hypothetical protein
VTFEERVRALVLGLRELLAERELLADHILAYGRPDLTSTPPSGPPLLSRRHSGRRTWFVVHASTLWFVANGAGGPRHSFGVDRTRALDERLVRMVGG